jgi:hypothetical protein
VYIDFRKWRNSYLRTKTFSKTIHQIKLVTISTVLITWCNFNLSIYTLNTWYKFCTIVIPNKYEWLLSFLKYVLIFIQTMGVVYILDGLKFGSTKLTMKWMNCFLHVSWLKFLVCIVLKVDFSSRVWRSNWYYTNIYRDSTVPPGMDWWWVLPFGEMPTSILKFVPLWRMLPALKKCEDFKSLTEWAEYNFRELWVRYFPAQTVGVVAATLVPRPWCHDSPFLCAHL